MNVEEFLPKRRSLWTYFVLEPLYKPVIEFFLNAGWHPNTVSAISVGFAVASVASFSLGRGYSSLFLGALFFELAYFFDCVDGPIARATGKFTRLGMGLEVVGDSLRNYGAMLGLTYRYSSSGKEWILIFSLVLLIFYNGAMWLGYKRLIEGDKTRPTRSDERIEEENRGVVGNIKKAFFDENLPFWPVPILVELETFVFFIMPLLNLGEWGLVIGGVVSPLFFIGALI